MILFSGSGGSTKGIGIYTIFKTLMKEKNIIPDIYVGISVSSIMSLPLMMRKFDELDYIFDNFTLDTIFNIKPVNEKGNITLCGAYRGLTRKSGLGEMKSLVDIMKSLVSEKEFYEFLNDKHAPLIYSMSVDYRTGSRILVNLKNLTYEEWLAHCLASGSIPVFSTPVEIDGKVLYDGGVRDHNASHMIIDKLSKQIKKVYSVYSRPQDNNIIINDWEATNVFKVLERTIDIMNIEISKNDDFKEKELCNKYNIELNTFFLPRVLNSLYDTDRGRLQRLKEESYKLVK